jgi:hypothetical protein
MHAANCEWSVVALAVTDQRDSIHGNEQYVSRDNTLRVKFHRAQLRFLPEVYWISMFILL